MSETIKGGVGAIAVEMAAVPVVTGGKPVGKRTMPDIVFAAGNGKLYPRTVGWGADKKPHPEGGQSGTAAWVRTKIGAYLVTLGRVYVETWHDPKINKQRTKYHASLSNVESTDMDALVEHVESLFRVYLRQSDYTPATRERGFEI